MRSPPSRLRQRQIGRLLPRLAGRVRRRRQASWCRKCRTASSRARVYRRRRPGRPARPRAARGDGLLLRARLGRGAHGCRGLLPAGKALVATAPREGRQAPRPAGPPHGGDRPRRLSGRGSVRTRTSTESPVDASDTTSRPPTSVPATFSAWRPSCRNPTSTFELTDSRLARDGWRADRPSGRASRKP